MGKKSRGKSSGRAPGRASGRASAGAVATEVDASQLPVVGMREPCPCGSGKRYKLCHGRAAHVAARAAEVSLVRRPFEGLPGECDWVALREIVPAATAVVRTTPEYGDAEVTVATALPMALRALRRADGPALVGLQVHGGSGDASRDIAGALLEALASEPGTPVTHVPVSADGPRLQDVLVLDEPLKVTVYEGFDFWLEDSVEQDAEVRASVEHANSAAVPTERLSSVEAAYWCRIGDRTHLRWVLPYEEDAVLDGLARLHARRESGLGEGTGYIGAFRAHGLLVPVWDLAPGAVADDVEEPAAAFGRRLEEAMAETAPLTADERRAREGVVSRQLTLR